MLYSYATLIDFSRRIARPTLGTPGNSPFLLNFQLELERMGFIGPPYGKQFEFHFLERKILSAQTASLTLLCHIFMF